MIEIQARIIGAGRVKELMEENAGGVLGPVDKDAGRITRIGVAAVDVKGLDALPCSFWKGTKGGVRTDIDRVGLSIGPLEHLENARP